MKVGWLADPGNADGTVGGAELTQAEFRKAAPEGVEVVDCPPGGVVGGLDRYVVHNCVVYQPEDIFKTGDAPTVKYCHDVWPHGNLTVKAYLIQHARLVFCSEPQRTHMGLQGDLVPPAVDLVRFGRRNGAKARAGAVSVGAWQNPEKGQQALVEWAKANGGLDVYGPGMFAPAAPPLDYKGPVAYNEVPKLLQTYATFVHLPWTLEPFGRGVVEAWASGMKLVVNRLVGACWWIEHHPDRLATAKTDFWDLVCG